MAAVRSAAAGETERTAEAPATEPVGRPLDIVVICQAVDRDDPILASTIRWIEALAGRHDVARVRVLALRTGRHHLEESVAVHRFGRQNRLARLTAFYREVARTLRPRPSLFLVYQGGPYPALLLPLRLLLRIPVVQWKAHPVIDRAMAFYARWCDDLLFTSTPTAFPMDLPKVHAVGQGIDTETFHIEARPLTGDLITVCRITPRKRVEEMISAVAHANREFGTQYRFDVYGPTLPGDEAYAARLEAVIDHLGARDWITLRGPIAHAQLPALLSGHRAFLNFAETALDRSVVEAMACGLPVISTNDSVIDILPPDLHQALIADKRSTTHQAEAIHALLGMPQAELRVLGERMREIVVAEHSLDRLFDRILGETRSSLLSAA
jgi:glycosyltransferase involved in cell wall biosynthesis